jgi:hypothetical protein
MENGHVAAQDSPDLVFSDVVKDRFSYLSEQGFVLKEILPTDLRFRKGDVEITVYWDQMSSEIDLAVVKGSDRYSMSEVLRAEDLGAAEEYRSWSAGTRESAISGVTALADLFARYGKSAAAGEDFFYSELKRKRREWSLAYSAAVLATGVRQEAEEAFRKGFYKDAAVLYRRIEAALTPSERGKLEFASRKAREQSGDVSKGC